MRKTARIVVLYLLLPLAGLSSLALIWLQQDAAKPLDRYFEARKGHTESTKTQVSDVADGQDSRFITLHSDSGLVVSFRVIRPAGPAEALPVLLVLGGHRTGSDAVDLFGNVGDRAVVALDYPYAGPEKIRGFVATIKSIPLARKAFTDTPPAVSLVLDWLEQQAWADQDQLTMIGASLGVPFAALVAARETRIDNVILVHGAADNEAWLEAQIARRNNFTFLHRPAATFIYWLAYGPTFDTAINVAQIAPRPVIIIGARDDERTPAGQTEALFAAAGEPKKLRWTEGRHIQPGRTEIVNSLLEIAAEELPFQTPE